MSNSINQVETLEIEYENKFIPLADKALPLIREIVPILNELEWADIFFETTEYKDLSGYSGRMLNILESRLKFVKQHIEEKRKKRNSVQSLH